MTEHTAVPSTTRLTGRPLWIMRGVWLVVVLLSIGLLLISLPTYHEALSTVCVETAEVCENLNRLTPALARVLEGVGLSLERYAILQIGFDLLFQAIWVGIGLAIFVRRSDDWMAALVSLFLIVFITVGFDDRALRNLSVSYGDVTWLSIGLVVLSDALITSFFLLFPNGRLVPRWLWWLIPLRMADAFLGYFPDMVRIPSSIGNSIFLASIALTLFAQVYRYRRISSTMERYQARWVFLGIVISFGGILTLGIAIIGFDLIETMQVTFLAGTVVRFLLTFIPISIGIAMLRANLYDVDIIIRRATSYAFLTGLLVFVYFGSIIALQQLIAPITGESTPAVVLSTLLIAALFLPLRRRVQDSIDRRFYRRKYDAEQVLQQFATTVRDETDLDALTAELIRVIQETMQPEHVSVWLRPIEPPTKDS